jgi:N-acetylmuramoyl-L-alanine amidase
MLNRTSLWFVACLILGTLACGCQNDVKVAKFPVTSDDELLNLNELAAGLGMNIKSASRGVVRMSNSSNKVLLFPAAGGAYVNSKPVGAPVDMMVIGGQTFVTRRLAKAIRGVLRPASPIRPPVVHDNRYPVQPIVKRLGTVLLDAGHGGNDPGATAGSGLREKDVVLPVAMDLARRLRDAGVDVKLTRSSDVFVTLDGRVDQANRLRPDLFISIHADANAKRALSGATIFVPRRENDVSGSYQAGREIFTAMSAANIHGRDMRTHPSNLRVLERTTCPAVLVEIGFMTNTYEEQLLSSPNYQQHIAAVLCNAIVEYLRH